MSNILVIPDIHHKTRIADAILSAPLEHRVDYTVFLGDYFDDFGDTPLTSTKTAEWLKESLTKPNRIHLMGNHDLHYRYWRHEYMQNPWTGWTIEKARAINNVLTPEDWDKLKWFHYEPDGNWLFTHAGLHPGILPPINNDAGELKINNALISACANANRALEAGDNHPLFRAGRARGGEQSVGGLVWLDWNEEFIPFEFHQVVGHTPVREPQVCFYDEEQKRFRYGNARETMPCKGASSPLTTLIHTCIIVQLSTETASVFIKSRTFSPRHNA